MSVGVTSSDMRWPSVVEPRAAGSAGQRSRGRVPGRAPAAHRGGSYRDQLWRPSNDRGVFVLGILSAQQIERPGHLRGGCWQCGLDHAGLAVDAQPPESPPIRIVLVDDQAHERAASQVAHPSQLAPRLGLGVYGRKDLFAIARKDDRDEVGSPVGARSRQPRHRPAIEEKFDAFTIELQFASPTVSPRRIAYP